MFAEEGAKPYSLSHRAYFFSKEIILFVSKAERERVFESLFEQLVRSATSVGANVVEGKSGSSKKDFINYLRIALKSSNETKYWLCLLRDTAKADREAVVPLIREADELSRIIASIILRTAESKDKS